MIKKQDTNQRVVCGVIIMTAEIDMSKLTFEEWLKLLEKIIKASH